MAFITVTEVSPRDGLQNEAVTLSPEHRAELVLRSLDAGVKRVEAVAFVNEARLPQMADPERVVARVRQVSPQARLAGLVLNDRGLDRALASEVSEVNLVVPCTDTMSVRNQGRDVATMIELTRGMAARARSEGVFVTLTVAVAFGCPFEGEVDPAAVRRVIAETVDAGIDEVALADTVGVGIPRQVRALTAIAAQEAPGIPLRYHFHNTRNTGYANASTAIELGVTFLDASTGGFGGCPFAPAATGNIATEDLIYQLERSGHHCGVDADVVIGNAVWLSQLLGNDPTALLGRAGWFPPRGPAIRQADVHQEAS